MKIHVTPEKYSELQDKFGLSEADALAIITGTMTDEQAARIAEILEARRDH